MSSEGIVKQDLFLILLRKMGWIIVLLLLLFLPFQQFLSQSLKVGEILWIDELMVVFSFILFSVILLYWGRVNRDGAKILLCLAILGCAGIISGLINNNPLWVTINGVFDYMKNFLVIPVFAILSVEAKNIESLYRVLRRLALFFSLVAIGQEIMFLAGLPPHLMGAFYQDYRFGLLRTPSLMGHPNLFGLYAILFFFLDFSIHRRIRWQNIILLMGIFLSFSRMVWAAFLAGLFALGIQRGSVKKMGVFILTTSVMIAVSPLYYTYTTEELGSESHFRGYVLSKSMDIIKDHPLLGVGPGMYGGVISFIFHSPVYTKYDFSQNWFEFASRIRSLDQFWPQLLGEMGLIGMMVFIVLLYFIWKIPRKASQLKNDVVHQSMLSGLSAVSISLFVYLFGSSLNLTPFLLTFGILLGLSIGAKDESLAHK